jgi:hypothetical protein
MEFRIEVEPSARAQGLRLAIARHGIRHVGEDHEFLKRGAVVVGVPDAAGVGGHVGAEPEPPVSLREARCLLDAVRVHTLEVQALVGRAIESTRT